MPPQETEFGGGAAGPFAPEFINFIAQQLGIPSGQGRSAASQGFFGGLRNELGVGQGGESPIDKTQTVAGNLGELIAGMDVTGAQGSFEEIAQTQAERQVGNIRERFAGTGTPAAVAESVFRSDVAPKITMGLAEIERQNRAQQLAAIIPLLQLAGGFTSLGTPQAGTAITPNPIVQGIQLGTGVISAVTGGGGGGSQQPTIVKG